MQWHEVMPHRWEQEKLIAAALLGDFESGIDSTGCAFVCGLFSVVSEHGHVYETIKIRITYPPNFPTRNQPQDANSLNDFFAVIHTFLFKQRVYQRRLVRSRLDGRKAEWPGEDRSHGIQGIREAVRDAGGIGRNDPCPCGSGKKFKRCHLGKL